MNFGNEEAFDVEQLDLFYRLQKLCQGRRKGDDDGGVVAEY